MFLRYGIRGYATNDSCLPQLQALALGNKHLVALLHAKRLIPSVDVGQSAVHTPLAKGVWVALHAVANFLLRPGRNAARA